MHFEGDVLQRPDVLAVAVAVAGLTDFERWVGVAAQARPPLAEVAAEGAAADLAEAVAFGEVFYADDWIRHEYCMMRVLPQISQMVTDMYI